MAHLLEGFYTGYLCRRAGLKAPLTAWWVVLTLLLGAGAILPLREELAAGNPAGKPRGRRRRL